MNCDHLYNDVWCDSCGRYQGQTCEFCGDWYDGGEHMADIDMWCVCGLEEFAYHDLRDETPIAAQQEDIR